MTDHWHVNNEWRVVLHQRVNQIFLEPQILLLLYLRCGSLQDLFGRRVISKRKVDVIRLEKLLLCLVDRVVQNDSGQLGLFKTILLLCGCDPLQQSSALWAEPLLLYA